MKRDMDLVRKILLGAEDGSYYATEDMNIDGHNQNEIVYHVDLMQQGGLINTIDVSTAAVTSRLIDSLTWEGSNFLDLARDDQKWEAAKKLVFEKTGGLNYELLKAVLLVDA